MMTIKVTRKKIPDYYQGRKKGCGIIVTIAVITVMGEGKKEVDKEETN